MLATASIQVTPDIQTTINYLEMVLQMPYKNQVSGSQNMVQTQCELLKSLEVNPLATVVKHEYMQLMQFLSGFAADLKRDYPIFTELQSSVMQRMQVLVAGTYGRVTDFIEPDIREFSELYIQHAQLWQELINNRLHYILHKYLDRSTMTLYYLDDYAFECLNICDQLMTDIDKLEDKVKSIIHNNQANVVIRTMHATGMLIAQQHPAISVEERIELVKNSLLRSSVVTIAQRNLVQQLLFGISLCAVHKNFQAQSQHCAKPPITRYSNQYYYTAAKNPQSLNGDVVCLFTTFHLRFADPEVILKCAYKNILEGVQAQQMQLQGSCFSLSMLLSNGYKINFLTIGSTELNLLIQMKHGKFLCIRIAERHNLMHHRKHIYYAEEEYCFNGDVVSDPWGANTPGTDMVNNKFSHIPPDMGSFTIAELLSYVNKAGIALTDDDIDEIHLVHKTDGVITDPDLLVVLKNTGFDELTHIEYVKIHEIISAESGCVRQHQSIGKLSKLAEAYYNVDKTAGLLGFAEYLVKCAQEEPHDHTTVVVLASNKPYLSIIADTHAVGLGLNEMEQVAATNALLKNLTNIIAMMAKRSSQIITESHSVISLQTYDLIKQEQGGSYELIRGIPYRMNDKTLIMKVMYNEKLSVVFMHETKVGQFNLLEQLATLGNAPGAVLTFGRKQLTALLHGAPEHMQQVSRAAFTCSYAKSGEILISISQSDYKTACSLGENTYKTAHILPKNMLFYIGNGMFLLFDGINLHMSGYFAGIAMDVTLQDLVNGSIVFHQLEDIRLDAKLMYWISDGKYPEDWSQFPCVLEKNNDKITFFPCGAVYNEKIVRFNQMQKKQKV